MLKKLIRLNLDDLWLYIGIEGGLFLLVEVIICGVMYFVRPDDSVTVCGTLMPILAGIVALVAGIAHVGISFDLSLRFGQTRKRAVGLTLGLMSFEGAFGLAFGAVLAALERLVCPSLWAKLAGMDGWVAGMTMGPMPEPIEGLVSPTGTFYVNTAGELLPLLENTLLVNVFTLDWYWWLLAFVAGLCGGMIAGALIQRFGAKGGWVVYGMCMAPIILGQLLPWKTYEITNWLFPLLGVMFAGAFLWSVWSMLHAVVRG